MDLIIGSDSVEVLDTSCYESEGKLGRIVNQTLGHVKVRVQFLITKFSGSIFV